jgi:serine/threonine-protein kinase SRPK3
MFSKHLRHEFDRGALDKNTVSYFKITCTAGSTRLGCAHELRRRTRQLQAWRVSSRFPWRYISPWSIHHLEETGLRAIFHSLASQKLKVRCSLPLCPKLTGSRCPRYVALKVLRADCYDGSHDIFETEILSKITEVSRQSSHPGRNHVLHHLDKFKHNGPNGEHVCLAFDVLGHHLDFQTAKYEDGRLPVNAVKLIAKQTLLGLDFLHRECGVIHTGMP